MVSRRTLAAVFVTLGLVATACGDDTTTTSSPTTTSSSAPATTSPATTSPETTSPETTSPETTSPVTTSPESGDLMVFFSVGDGSDCSRVAPFPRRRHGELAPLDSAITHLLAGPTVDEVASGASSVFSDQTSGALNRVWLTDGRAVIDIADLRGWIAASSASCSSMATLAQLTATTFQFDEIRQVRFQTDNSCESLFNWLQRECTEFDRDGEIDLSVEQRADGHGCIADDIIEGRYFGFIDEATTDALSFDLACWYIGAAAAEAASIDGSESPPPNDYHITNRVSTVRRLVIDPSADVNWMPTPGDPASAVDGSVVEWVDGRADRPWQPGVWIDVVDGTIVDIVEQYQP